MKKWILIICLLLLPGCVFAKEFKQMNQTVNSNNLCMNNKANTYKLSNDDYLVAESGYLTRITSNGTEVWSFEVDSMYYDILLIDDYVYVSGYDYDLRKIDISNGNVVKTIDGINASKLAKQGNYIIAIVDGFVFRLDQNLNEVDDYNSSSDLDANQYTYNFSVTTDDNYVYIINMVGTPFDSTYTDNQGVEQTYVDYDYDSRIIKLDQNLNYISSLPINEDYLSMYDYGGAFFTDNKDNLYIVDGIIVKINKQGNTEILYDPYQNINEETGANSMIIKNYEAGTIVGNYLVVGGSSGTVDYNPPSIKNYMKLNVMEPAIHSIDNGIPIVDVYDMSNKLVEEHELKSNSRNDNTFYVYNINKNSNDGFLVKWASYYDNGMVKASVSGTCPLYVSEFGKVRGVKVNVNGSGSVRITPNDCACGDLVTLDIDEKPGYYLRSVTVRDANGKKIKVKNNQFTMPCNGDVTIDAQFREITNPKTSSVIIISILLGTIIFGSTVAVGKKVFNN